MATGSKAFTLRTAAFSAVFALLASGAVASPASAAPPGYYVEVSVIGELPEQINGDILVDDLLSVGVTAAQVTQIKNGQTVSLPPTETYPDTSGGTTATVSSSALIEPEPTPGTTALDSSYGRLGAPWTDSKAKTIVVRRGTSTFGYNHFVPKHNTTIAVARTTTKFPKVRKEESSSSWRYETPVYKLVCSPVYCSKAATMNVRAIVNPNILSDGYRKGVITTYCIGISGLCPDWVKNAANAN